MNFLKQNKNSPEDSDYEEDYNDESTLINGSNGKHLYGSVTGTGNGSDKTEDDGVVLNMEERITYAWKDIDVFGELKSDSYFQKYVINNMRKCCTKSSGYVEHTTKKHLLKSVTGIARSGEILAVLGSSGAGKTTLLNALAFRSPPGIRISGSRTINGNPVDAAYIRSKCAYVQQDDLFIGSLSVREHLIFQAMLRMDRKLPYKAKVARVEQVINELSLRKCVNTVIGVPGRIKGLSGGWYFKLATVFLQSLALIFH
jgi:ABC-type transport system involved in cytochrome bd biosynthesis fused ATPase/permease subunit